MKKINLFLSTLLLAVFFISCEKEKPEPKLEGTFEGSFTLEGSYFPFTFRDIEQDGEDLDGTFEFGAARGIFNASSERNGDEVYIEILVSNNGITILFKFDGEVNSDIDRMNGFLDLCMDGDCISAGAWSASKTSSKSAEEPAAKSAPGTQFDQLMRIVKQLESQE